VALDHSDKALKSGHDPKRVKEVVDKCPKNNQSVIRYVIRFIQVLAQPGTVRHSCLP
jgi:hypothetical protein